MSDGRIVLTRYVGSKITEEVPYKTAVDLLTAFDKGLQLSYYGNDDEPMWSYKSADIAAFEWKPHV